MIIVILHNKTLMQHTTTSLESHIGPKGFEAVGIETKRQRLLFRGKQLEDSCDLLDYRIDHENIIDVTEIVVLEEVGCWYVSSTK